MQSIKDRLLEEGNNAVSIIRYETKVKYVYTYKNIKLAKKSFREDD